MGRAGGRWPARPGAGTLVWVRSRLKDQAEVRDRGLSQRDLRVITRGLRLAPREFAFGGLLTLLWVAGTILGSMVLGQVTDRLVLPAVERGGVGAAALAVGFGALAGVGLLRGIGVLGRRLGAHMAQYRLQATYRRDVTGRYLDLPLEWHRARPTGRLLAHVSADAEAASFVAAPLPMALGTTLMLVITGLLLVFTDLILALIGFVAGPALLLLNSWFQRRMRSAAVAAQAGRGKVSAIAHESIDAALAIKTMGRERQEVDRLRAASEELRDHMIRIGRLRAIFDPLFEAIPTTATLAVLLVGALRVTQGQLSPGELVTFAYLFRLVATPMRVFGWLLGELPRGTAGLDRIDAVLRHRERVVHGDAELPGAEGLHVDLQDVTYHHPVAGEATGGDGAEHDDGGAHADVSDAHQDPSGGNGGDAHPQQDGDGTRRPAAVTRRGRAPAPTAESRGLAGVSLDVAPGRTVAVVGPTGSGKSTLASLLVRLVDPHDGAVLADGRDLRDLTPGALGGSLAIAFQEPFLFDDTVRENITLGADLDDQAVRRAARVAQADRFISALPEGYDTVIGERGATLSGGQRQRIALARAVVRHPRLLVLDDATSSVDAKVEAAILRGLAASDLPATTVLVAYRLGSIMLADEVVYIEQGRVVARGTHTRLLAEAPGYRDLVTAYQHRERRASGQAGMT